MIQLSKAFSDDTVLRRVFSWLTRTGAGRKFGSLPIAWYQMHQCHCIDILKERGADVVRVRRGQIETRRSDTWQAVISPLELFTIADQRSRQESEGE